MLTSKSEDKLMDDRARKSILMARGKRLLVLKVLIVVLVAVYLRMYEQLQYATALSSLAVAIAAIGLLSTTAPAIAKGKGYGRWATATALFWCIICASLSFALKFPDFPVWVFVLESVLVKGLIIVMALKTYLDFLVFRQATRQ